MNEVVLGQIGRNEYGLFFSDRMTCGINQYHTSFLVSSRKYQNSAVRLQNRIRFQWNSGQVATVGSQTF